DIRSGDLLLCSGSTFFSRMIRRVTRSVWSHVAFVIRLETIDRIMVLESVESVGVRTIPLSRYVRDYSGQNEGGYPGRLLLGRHKSFSMVSKPEMTKMSQFAVDLFGYPYDRDEILRIGARICKNLLGFREDEVQREREYICSEYVWECYNSLNIRVDHDTGGFIAPRDFARDLKVFPIAAINVES
ncbi:MAG: hypothetical protein KAT00_04150, partial [Planctomycetes bacterium]|nr:hypothetical protein [Planctomycetota bacterium]